MPATGPVPSLADFNQAYADALIGERDEDLDTREGSSYDVLGGNAALIWSRQAQRDRDLFRQNYVTTASVGLDRLVERQYGVQRILETYGSGTVILSAPAVDEYIWTGQRVEVIGGPAPIEYIITTDARSDGVTPLVMPVRASRTGPGTAIATTSNLRLQNDTEGIPVQSLVCGDGTNRERDEDYLARARKFRLDNRNGYYRKIIDACRSAGASNVVALHAGTFGPALDFGLNYVYVADANYVTPPGMITACMLALEKVRILGCDLQVLGMVQTPVTVTETVALWDDPGYFDTTALASLLINVLVDEFNARQDFWIFRKDSLGGAQMKASSAVQSVSMTTSPGEPTAGFVATLPRYSLAGGAVSIAFTGPT